MPVSVPERVWDVALCVQEFKIQNIVGSCDVKFPIRLEGLCMAHGYFATVSVLADASRGSYEKKHFKGVLQAASGLTIAQRATG